MGTVHAYSWALRGPWGLCMHTHGLCMHTHNAPWALRGPWGDAHGPWEVCAYTTCTYDHMHALSCLEGGGSSLSRGSQSSPQAPKAVKDVLRGKLTNL